MTPESPHTRHRPVPPAVAGNDPAPAPQAALDLQDQALAQAIDRALGQPLTPVIPPGFAERVAYRAVHQPHAARRAWLGWGPRLALASGLLLTLGMFVVAPHAAPSLTNASFDTELILLAELSGLLLFAPRLFPQR